MHQFADQTVSSAEKGEDFPLCPVVQLSLADSEAVQSDVSGKILFKIVVTEATGDTVDGQPIALGKLSEKVAGGIGATAANWRKFIIDEENFHANKT
jgi:hypothetical protein